jgi:heptosyltransferase-2
MRILVRSPNWIGDQVLAYPFFFFLRRAFPRARITVACVPWVESLQFRDLIDDVVLLSTPVRKSRFAKLAATERSASALRKLGPWDLGITLPNSFSSAWLFKRAGVRERRGFVAEGRGFLLTQKLDWEHAAPLHRSDAYLSLLPDGDGSHRKPELGRKFWGMPPEDPDDPADEGVKGVLSRFEPEKSWPAGQLPSPVLDPPSEPYWVLAPGSQAESRRWSAESFSSLARQIHMDTGMRGLIVGGPGEAVLAGKLCEDRRTKLSDWTAQGAVASYWKVFRDARFTVSNDSGLAHVAALCGSPVEVVWGGGDPKHTEPTGPGRVKLVLNPVECWPCERNTCMNKDEDKLRCLRGIQPDAVWQEIRRGFRI